MPRWALLELALTGRVVRLCDAQVANIVEAAAPSTRAWAMSADRRSIVVAGGVRRLRRRLGPTAWFVLEELLERVAR